MKTFTILCVTAFVVLVTMTSFPAGAAKNQCDPSQATEWTIVEGEGDHTYAIGTPGDDVFVPRRSTDPGPFIVFGLAGDDLICGSSRGDVIYGGAGDDVLRGRGGSDQIHGEGGDDFISGGTRPDVLVGGAGQDAIRSSSVDTVKGAKAAPGKPEPKAKPEPKPNPKAERTPKPDPTPTATPDPTPTPTPLPDPDPNPNPPPSGGAFTVAGRQILDPAGDVFLPIGANASPPLRDSVGSCVWWLSLRCSDMTGRLSSVQEWNWNTLRLNLKCGNYVNSGTGEPYGPAEMLAATDQIVNEYTAAGVVVILDCHPYIAKAPAVGGAVWNEITAFWDLAIPRYKDNPYVWINFANEFVGGDGDPGYFKSFTEAAYNHLVGAGYEGVMVMDLPNWAQHIQFFNDPANVAWSKQFDQVVWDWHAYGGISQDGTVDSVRRDMPYAEMSALYDDILANLAANEIPVINGEFGHDWNDQRQTDDGWSYISMVNAARLNIEKLPGAGIGMTVWHANGSSGVATVFGLKQSDSLIFDQPTVNTELSALGELYWAMTRTLGG